MNIEQRLQLLEDKEAIRTIKHYNYCHCIDRTVAGEGAAIDELLPLLADDIVADFTGLPLMQGREEVSNFFAHGVPAFLSYCQHRVTNDVIRVDGDNATGLWYIDCPAVFREGNPTGKVGSGFIGGRYEEEYRREGGIWKLAKITALLDIESEFQENWQSAKQLFTNR
ncbi:nuclear transport factor 2 family protein [Spongiibacter sp. KMU-158]|uniref:Nuclear transport factor 2 family protein n=1 Tax=Spongiibacter pelagi TaxID=2760804 RepID=A0A927GWV5_9GAMM|nr:nuclear transport factor 2 family protein [Spongiibacter pelagi]MBD2859865.1 nuclear transport factor 2 family protein [Spongiibacter pelagi]